MIYVVEARFHFPNEFELKVQGELEHEQILAVIKQVDIVICALASPQVMEQLKIIDAIKVAGNIKVSTFSDGASIHSKIITLKIHQNKKCLLEHHVTKTIYKNHL